MPKAEDYAKHEFLSRVDRDVRTPLTTIIGCSEMILDEVQDQDAKLTQDVRRVLAAARELCALVDHAQNISSINAGTVIAEPVLFDVAAVVQEVAGSMESAMRKQANVFAVRIQPRVDQMVSDPARLKQILFELLTNAAKFTYNGSVTLEVSVRSEDARELLVFEVRDTGLGIPPDRMARIFEPFFQVDSSATRSRNGAGLGLAVCRGLCELLGGQIDAQSKFGQGSVFTIVLPGAHASLLNHHAPL